MTTRVAVVGAGAIGGYVGGRLSLQPGLDVVMCVRTRFDRLVIETISERIDCRISTADDPSEVDPVDVVLLAVKAHQTSAARSWLDRLTGPSTTVAVLQNGVEHQARLGESVPAAQVVPVVVRFGAERVSPGSIRLTLDGDLVVPATERGRALTALFAGSALRSAVAVDFERVLWTKLAHNIVSNPLTAILGLRVNQLAGNPVAVALQPLLVRECMNVAVAENVQLAEDLDAGMLARLAAMPDSVVSSMFQDLGRGDALECDALTGAVVRIGARHGIPTPVNSAVLTVLQAISPRGPSLGGVPVHVAAHP